MKPTKEEAKMIYRRWSLLLSTVVIWGSVATAGLAGIFLFGGKICFQALKKQEANFVLRSTGEVVSSNTRIHVFDTLGELKMLYRISPVAVVGGSFLSTLAGYNISEAAAAGCAVLTGPHVGHFYQMLVEMWQINPLAVKQVTGEL